MREVGVGGFARFGDKGAGNFEEEELAWFGSGMGGGAEVGGGDASGVDGGEGVVGVELGTGAAVGVEVGEDAD